MAECMMNVKTNLGGGGSQHRSLGWAVVMAAIIATSPA